VTAIALLAIVSATLIGGSIVLVCRAGHTDVDTMIERRKAEWRRGGR
jgi:hypothetical protein